MSIAGGNILICYACVFLLLLKQAAQRSLRGLLRPVWLQVYMLRSRLEYLCDLYARGTRHWSVANCALCMRFSFSHQKFVAERKQRGGSKTQQRAPPHRFLLRCSGKPNGGWIEDKLRTTRNNYPLEQCWLVCLLGQMFWHCMTCLAYAYQYMYNT